MDDLGSDVPAVKHATRLLCLALIGIASGCMFGASAPPSRPRPVEVPAGHEHSGKCGHFYQGERWYHQHGHEHGPGCGHVRQGRRWITP